MVARIFTEIAAGVQANKAAWLATIIHAEGSTPARMGMKMLTNADGTISGTVGGGAVEKRVIDKIVAEKPISACRWCFDLNGKTLQHPDYEATGMVCGGTLEVLVEPLFNAVELYIIGGGHCGKALTELAVKCGFAVTIIDDRPEIARSELHPHANRVICSPYPDITSNITFSANTYIVAMTHGHKHDILVMEKILGKEYNYFGVIGSKNKVKTAFARLQKKGFTNEKLQTVFSPVGFSIKSQTPMEVAVSIMAQLIAVRNGVTEISFNSNILNGEASILAE